MRERFDEMRRMGIRTVMITGDNPLTARAIAEEAGVDDFLAEATPEDKMALIKQEQEGGRLVAMTGDGTNDAPALAQADVGVAMNTGTSAAKEAGNMVDLDSNPTKLIEIVEIGKQLLITRGSLTTFSIANDVAKYFAIIPAMFAGVYPGLDTLNIMRLASPESAILSAVIFNALIIVGADPAGPARRALHAVLGRRDAAPQPAASTASAASSPRSSASSSSTCWSPRSPASAEKADTLMSTATPPARRRGSTVAALRTLLVLTVLLGLAYPLVDDRHRPGRRSTATPTARWSPSTAGRRLDLIGQAFTRRSGTASRSRRRRQPVVEPDPTYFQSRPSAAGDGYDPLVDVGVQPRPGEHGPARRDQGAASAAAAKLDGVAPVQRPAGRAAGQRLRPRPATSARRTRAQQVARVARERGLAEAAGARAGRRAHPGPHARLPRRAAGQRARAQPRPRPGRSALRRRLRST